MTQQSILVGNKGSGKSLFGAYYVDDLYRQHYWNGIGLYPFVSNMQYNSPNREKEFCVSVADILATMAQKLIIKSRMYWTVFVDEAAAAGLESRRSYLDPEVVTRSEATSK